MQPSSRRPFWERRTLDEMTPRQWESLCDGCGRCCLEKLEDTVTGRITYTCVACRLLDSERCRCRDYRNRHLLIPGCLVLTPAAVKRLNWLPRSCAYRRLAEGRPLEWWHPLVCGDPETVHRAGMSVRGKVVPGQYAAPDALEAYAIDGIL